MLVERLQAAVPVPKMAAADDNHTKEDITNPTAADIAVIAESNLEKDVQNPKPEKFAQVFEVDFGSLMPGKPATNLQEAFQKFKKRRQDDIKEQKRMLRQQREAKRDPERMEALRHKFLEQTKRYFGVPYARKYWPKDSPEYNSPLFLDCCGLVRQVMRDLHAEFGFRIGPWNQAYMYDTLPIALDEAEMRPGDLVFMTGTYVNPKSKRQRHDMMHVEVWLGQGPKTIGARWNNGKVQVFDSYRFNPKSFRDEQYLFRSIDTWLMGICKSHCDKHAWGLSSYNPSKKSVFFNQQDFAEEDEKAGDDDDDFDEEINEENRMMDSGNFSPRLHPGRRGDGVVVESVGMGGWPTTGVLPNQQKGFQGQKRWNASRGRQTPQGVPQSTRNVLQDLEQRIDGMVAHKVDLFSGSRQQCPVKNSSGMRGSVLVSRPSTSMEALAQHGRPAMYRENSSPQHVLSLTHKRRDCPSPVVQSWAMSPSPHTPDLRHRPRWLEMSLGASTARGSLSVVGQGQTNLKKNKSCNDLEAISGRPKLSSRGGGHPHPHKNTTTPTTKPWRHSAPETLGGLSELTMSPHFHQNVHVDVEAPEKSSVTCSSPASALAFLASLSRAEERERMRKGAEREEVEGEGERSEDEGETSVACDSSDCCWSDGEEEFNEDDECMMDTDEELDRCQSLNITIQTNKDGTELPPPALLLNHPSTPNHPTFKVTEGEGGALTGNPPPPFSPNLSPLPTRGMRSFLLPLDDPFDLLGSSQGPEAEQCDVVLDNQNNNASRSQSSGTSGPSKIQYSLQPSKSLMETTTTPQLAPPGSHGQGTQSARASHSQGRQSTSGTSIQGTQSTAGSCVQRSQSMTGSGIHGTQSTTGSGIQGRQSTTGSGIQGTQSAAGSCVQGREAAAGPQVLKRNVWMTESTPTVGSSSASGATCAAPEDGDGRTGGEGGAPCSGAGGDKKDNFCTSGLPWLPYLSPRSRIKEDARRRGERGMGAGGGRGNGGKKTPRGRPSKLPACSLPTNMTPTFFVGGGNGVALVEGPLLALGWKRITDKHDERYKLKWVECKSKINYTLFKEGDQLVNHIPNCKLLTNKLGLLCSLQEYERVTLFTKGRPPRLRMCDFVPETYKLDERVDRAAFLDVYKDGEMWICKPVGMNQGKGIFLLRSRQEIDDLLAEREAQRESNKYSTRPPTTRIVQRYITNPLLLEGRKFDIRAYMLIASTVPYLLLFHHGYIRLSCLKYSDKDTNLTTHLTNQSVQLKELYDRSLLRKRPFVQKKDPNYKDVKEDTAWTMSKFNDYVNSNYCAEKGIEEDWVFNSLTRQMQRIMLHCFNSVKHKLQCKVGYFDLYGLDFMVDTNMKVWLIEINVNPALVINCEALKEVIPKVVEETLHVAIEAFDKTRKHQPLLPLQSLKGFQILHCGTMQFNTFAPRPTRSVSPSKTESPERQRPVQALHQPPSPRCSQPRGLPRMSLSTTQVSPYLISTQGGNPGGIRSSQTTLPNILHNNGSASRSTRKETTTVSSSSTSSKSAIATTTINFSTSISPNTATTRSQPLLANAGTRGSDSDVTYRLIPAKSAPSVRKFQEKSDRGN